MLVTCFQQASKKNFSFWDFCFQVYAHLIELSPLAGGASQAERAGGLVYSQQALGGSRLNCMVCGRG